MVNNVRDTKKGSVHRARVGLGGIKHVHTQHTPLITPYSARQNTKHEKTQRTLSITVDSALDGSAMICATMALMSGTYRGSTCEIDIIIRSDSDSKKLYDEK